MSQGFNTCRFCKDWRPNKYGELIKYGVRHYAHADCLLRGKGMKGLTRLHDWQIENFPYFAAVEAGPGYKHFLEARLEQIKAKGEV